MAARTSTLAPRVPTKARPAVVKRSSGDPENTVSKNLGTTTASVLAAKKRPVPSATGTPTPVGTASKRQATTGQRVAIVGSARPAAAASIGRAPTTSTTSRASTASRTPTRLGGSGPMLLSDKMALCQKQLQEEQKRAARMVEQLAGLKGEQAEASKKIAELEQTKDELMAKYALIDRDLQREVSDRIRLIQEHDRDRTQLIDKKALVEAMLEESRLDNKDLRRRQKELDQGIELKASEIQKLRVQISSLQEEAAEAAKKHMREIKSRDKEKAALTKGFGAKESMLSLTIEGLREDLDDRQGRLEQQQQQITGLLVQVNKLQDERRAGELVRRDLHNKILDLKGNIRVMCRVRPALPSDIKPTPSTPSKSSSSSSSSSRGTPTKTPTKRSSIVPGAFPFEEASAGCQPLYLFCPSGDDRTMAVTEPIASCSSNQLQCSAGGKVLQPKKHSFQFDRVFDPSASQSDVFEEISQLVQSACDGYNVCIFAYGQTGSGKTFTMEGPPRPDAETRGMISRTVDQLFQTAQKLEEMGWRYSFQAQFVEIYNDTIRDLLSHDERKHDIVHDADGHTVVTDAVNIEVKSPAQVSSLLAQAAKRRSTAETKKNDRSSRSHSVFQMRIVGHNAAHRSHHLGILNLVDLAGSERLKSSEAAGERLKETQSINSSLAALGNVIQAISKNQQHVPFRDSKLTQLLQSSLGGKAKTLMFVNISPNQTDLPESLNSLRFATTVNNCTIGAARKNAKTKTY